MSSYLAGSQLVHNLNLVEFGIVPSFGDASDEYPSFEEIPWTLGKRMAHDPLNGSITKGDAFTTAFCIASILQ